MTFLNSPEDMKWLKDVHLPSLDPSRHKSAILHGNEDCPERIDVYVSPDPLHTDPYTRWTLQESGDYKAVQGVCDPATS